MKRHSIQRSRKQEDFKGLRTTARRSTRHTPMYYFVVLSSTFSCFLDVSQESQKNRGKKSIALPIEGLWGGTVRSATSAPAMSRRDRSRSPRRSSGRRAATLADSFDDPKCSKDHNNRSPPLAFRTYQILPHTNSYFHCLHGYLDLLQ